MTYQAQLISAADRLGLAWPHNDGAALAVHTPIDGSLLCRLPVSDAAATDAAISAAHRSFVQWRNVPAPARGEAVRLFAQKVRDHKQDLARVIAFETGKILQEGLGEVQEVIDICDFAVGLSRQLHGLTIASERPDHKLLETWHPLGVVGVISAFNFPMAVWAWNATLALVAGNTLVWKPSEKTPLSALALHQLLAQTLAAQGFEAGVSSVLIGGPVVGEA
ncbi:MAG: aldehyde dehydrogenase family protein, partial [Rhizobacter sp.]|nr:aldehyde dehydrogenase family protein [Rhizobacter sp.]